MADTRKIAAILVADVVGYSRLAGADEEGTLARLRALRSDLIDPAVALHHGRVVKRTGDGSIIEFRSVVDAVRCAIEVQTRMVDGNAGVPEDRGILFRIGIHLGDVVEESDGDLMGDGVNIAARIEGVANPGAICLSEDAYRQVKGRLDLAVIDLGPTQLKNIAEPIRLYSLEVGAPVEAKPMPPPSQEPGPPRLSIVVLPFVNIGGDPEQEHFVDGVTESLTTDLSRIRGSFVIGRNTAFTFKGKAVDLKQIGRELNVRYVLEGSVQRSGNRMRVNVQLIDAQSRAHLWAERFDKPVADLFDMQDEIVARLASALNTQLISAEARRAERAPAPDSMDLYFQGMAIANKGTLVDHVARSSAFFRDAISLDAHNFEAMAGLAFVNANSANGQVADDRAERLATAHAAAMGALTLAPDHALAHFAMGIVHLSESRPAQGIAECELAITLDRNLAFAHAYIGLAKTFLGRAQETGAHVREALSISPRDVNAYVWMTFVGISKLYGGDDDQAVLWLRRSMDTNRSLAIASFLLAAALALLGELDEAASQTKIGLSMDTAFTIRRYREGANSGNSIYHAQRQRIYNGMKLAGVPEG
jgi:TolB-like protein/class 3 adenylate cyclase